MNTEYRFDAFLADSFALLRREVPPIYTEMCRRLASHSVRMLVDADALSVEFTEGEVRLPAPHAAPTIELRTTRATILDLLDARRTLLDAVLDDVLFLRGTPDALLAFHEGLMAYLHGAFRAPSFRRLLRTFRDDARHNRPRQQKAKGG